MNRALITGITGQTGSYLAELLLEKGYEVHGLVRQSSSDNLWRLREKPILDDLQLHYGDVTDGACVIKLIRGNHGFDEIYNLAAQSYVNMSFECPKYSAEVNYLGCLNLLEAIRMYQTGFIKFYQASTSELFGNVPGACNEGTPMKPISPYGIAKLAAYNTVRMYRQAYGIFAVNGILFNHESPRRAEQFLSKKICRAAARISKGLQRGITIGDLSSTRDFGYAPEFAEGIWSMMQGQQSDDFVLATGKENLVEDFVNAAFETVGLNWKEHTYKDNRLIRPIEVTNSVGDATKFNSTFGWKPKVFAPEIVEIMMDYELAHI